MCCKGKGRQTAKAREKEVNERALQLLDAMSTVHGGTISGRINNATLANSFGNPAAVSLRSLKVKTLTKVGVKASLL